MRTRRDATAAQREYYEKASSSYGSHHVQPRDEHHVGLEYVSGFISMFQMSSVLDVGTGTGRALDFLQHRSPELRLVGLDPVSGLLREAGGQTGSGARALVRGSADSLPFPDASFDAVTATGVLHHVPRPDMVVAEMLRVARKAVFISDGNRFGQGSAVGRIAKLALWGLGLWDGLLVLRTAGRRYHVSEGDGIAYSYSVFDSLGQVAGWADRVVTVNTSASSDGMLAWFHPLLTSSHVLLAGVREPPDSAWAGLPLNRDASDSPDAE